MSEWFVSSGAWCVLVLAVLCGCTRPAADSARGDAKSSNSKTADAAPWFTEVTRESGVGLVHAARGARGYFFPAIMSPGVGWVDFDRDGDLDVLIADGTFLSADSPAAKQEPASSAAKTKSSKSSDASAAPPGSSDTPHLLRQNPDHTFSDVTSETGLAIPMYCSGMAIGDVNQDGYPDVYLTAFGGDRLLVNRGGAKFEDVTTAAGIGNRAWATSAAMLDYDRDGWLDVVVCNYVDYDPTFPCIANNGSRDFCNPALFGRSAAKLYRNTTGETGGERVTFADRSLESGIALQRGAGLGVVCGDLNRDGWPDIYVANDGHANFLWINQRNGTFEEQAMVSGVAYDNAGRSQGSMGVSMEDINGDLAPDLFVTNLDGETNVLYLAAGKDGFAESAQAAGLGAPSFPYTGFGVAFLDVDRDGDLDLAVANGRVRRLTTAAVPSTAAESSLDEFWKDYQEPNLLFTNLGRGRFRRVESKADSFLTQPSVCRALALGDYDDDGDLDMLVTTTGGPARLFRNDFASSGHWLLVQALLPKLGDRDAIGAEITVHAGERRWRRWVNPGASYLSSHDPRVHFGLGETESIDRVEVVWPDGERESFTKVEVDRVVALRKGSGTQP